MLVQSSWTSTLKYFLVKECIQSDAVFKGCVGGFHRQTWTCSSCTSQRRERTLWRAKCISSSLGSCRAPCFQQAHKQLLWRTDKTPSYLPRKPTQEPIVLWDQTCQQSTTSIQVNSTDAMKSGKKTSGEAPEFLQNRLLINWWTYSTYWCCSVYEWPCPCIPFLAENVGGLKNNSVKSRES